MEPPIYFCVWNSHGHCGHMTMAIPDMAFSAVQLCSYTIYVVVSTVGLLSDHCASCLEILQVRSF